MFVYQLEFGHWTWGELVPSKIPIPSSQGCAFSVLLLHTCMPEWVNGWVSFYILSVWLVCYAHGFHVCVYEVG